MSKIEVDKVIPQSGTALQVGDSGDTITIPAGATITNNGTANGFGSADTEKVKVSSNDTTAGFLNGKLVAGTNISLTEGSDGGNETLTAALSGTISTAQIGANQVTGAKLNTDVISAQTELVAEPADTDEFLVSDAGVLKRIDYSLIKGGGKILQVASVNFAGDASTTSSSFQKAGTNFEVSLTPSSTNSKILVQMAGGNAYLNDDREMHVQMYRKIGSGSLSAMTANDVDGQSASIGYVMRAIQGIGQMQIPHSFNYLDTPNTTSAVTYAPYFKSTTGNAVYFNTTDGVYWMIGLTAMEIEG